MRIAPSTGAPPAFASSAPHPRGQGAGWSEPGDVRGVRGIVLAGSYYWGEGAFEQLLRGPLLPVAQRPVICYSLAWLRDSRIPGAVICANGSTPMVRRALGDGASMGIGLSYIEDDQPRGPAGCARDAAALEPADTYVLVEGAMIPSLDLDELLAAHRRTGAVATTVVEIDRRKTGVGRSRRAAPGGVYVLQREVLESVPATGFHDIKQGLLERLYAAGEPVHVHEVQGLSPRVLDYASYSGVSGWLIATAARRPEFRDYVAVGEGLRHPSAEIHPSARIVGPALIGPGARIEAGAVLVGPVSVGAHSVVGAGALVARSSVWENCEVGAGAVVDRSLLAHAVVVAPDARLTDAVEVVDGAGQLADVLAPTHAPDLASVTVPTDFSMFEEFLARSTAAR